MTRRIARWSGAEAGPRGELGCVPHLSRAELYRAFVDVRLLALLESGAGEKKMVEGFGETEVAALLSDFDGVYGTGPYPLLDNTSHMLYRTALAWSFISFTWAEQATAQEIQQAFDLGRAYDNLVAAEDYVGAELVLRDWGGLGKVVFERMRPPAAVPALGAFGVTVTASLLRGLGALLSQTRRRTA